MDSNSIIEDGVGDFDGDLAGVDLRNALVFLRIVDEQVQRTRGQPIEQQHLADLKPQPILQRDVRFAKQTERCRLAPNHCE